MTYTFGKELLNKTKSIETTSLIKSLAKGTERQRFDLKWGNFRQFRSSLPFYATSTTLQHFLHFICTDSARQWRDVHISYLKAKNNAPSIEDLKMISG